MTYPRSAYDQVDGLFYFARMLDKIRLHETGQLPSDYDPFLEKGSNQRLCAYLRIDYRKLVERVNFAPPRTLRPLREAWTDFGADQPP
jgi:hypothetical protein